MCERADERPRCCSDEKEGREVLRVRGRAREGPERECTSVAVCVSACVGGCVSVCVCGCVCVFMEGVVQRL